MSNYVLKDRWTIQIISPSRDEWSRIPLHRREGGGWTNDNTLAESFPTREAAQAKLVELINEGDIGDAYNVGVFQVVTVDFLYGAKPTKPKDNMEQSKYPTHACKICGAMWVQWDADKSWSVLSKSFGKCCDNVGMGDQILKLAPAAGAPSTDTKTDEICWLIEHHARPAWYGLACNGRGATWVPASMAVRFARKEDAYAMIGILGLDTDRYKATEHVFCSWTPQFADDTGLSAITPEMIKDGRQAVKDGKWVTLADLRVELADVAYQNFGDAAKPLIKYLNDNMEHPHYKVIVTNTGAELVEGSLSYKDSEFVKD